MRTYQRERALIELNFSQSFVCHLAFSFMFFRKFGVHVPKGALILILEMGKICQSDAQQYLLSAKQIKIIFEESSGLDFLADKVLPMLFDEVFQVRYSGYITHM